MVATSKSRRTSKTWLVALVVVSVLVAAVAIFVNPTSSTPARSRGNTHIAEYMQANWDEGLARGIPYPARTQAKVLRGSWSDMGEQYGRHFGKYIRIVYDANFELFQRSQLDTGKLGAVLDLYQKETQKLSPEMVQFVRGISRGAAPVLKTANHAAALTDMQKIMLINCLFEVVLPSAWSHVAELMKTSPPHTDGIRWEPFASHAWAAWGDMTTRDYKGIIGGTRDQPWFPTLYNAAYVAIPSDRRAAVTWGNTIAGMVAASAQVNEHGVGVGNTIVSHKRQYFGVPALLSTAYISFFAHTAREAADIYTVGTPKYRKLTGRKTLASTVGFFQTFADARGGLVVERTGRHFAIRKAGYLGERGKYLVLPNHAQAPDSIDEQGKPTGQPMVNWTEPVSPDSSSWSRNWALFYEFDHNIGRVTPGFAQKRIARMKHTYTADGKIVTEQDGIPVWRLGLTPERHLIPNPADPNSLETGGNNMYFVADLQRGIVRWVQGIPSHWRGPWEEVSLRHRR